MYIGGEDCSRAFFIKTNIIHSCIGSEPLVRRVVVMEITIYHDLSSEQPLFT
jgi:hypothetical protein